MVTSKSSGTSQRKPRRKRMDLFILNDNKNSFEYVIRTLCRFMPMCNTLQAEQIAIIVDGSGECKVYSGFEPEIYLLYIRFQKAGLTVQIRQH